MTLVPSLGFVVVTHNSARVIHTCLAHLARFVGDSRIIVVDDASSDATLAIVAGFGSRVSVVPNAVGRGYGSACNQGASQLESEFVVFLNPDVFVERCDTVAARSALDANRVVAFQQRQSEGRVTDGLFPFRTMWRERITYTFGLLPAPASLWRVVDALGKQRPVRMWASGGILGIDRRWFIDLGGFDERLFLYYEDTDFGRRAAGAGVRVACSDAITAVHDHGRSTHVAADDPVRLGWAVGGLLAYVEKWHGRRAAVRCMRAMCNELSVIRTLLRLAHRLVPGNTDVVRKLKQVSGLLDILRNDTTNRSTFLQSLSG